MDGDLRDERGLWLKGRPKTGGRKPGSSNKYTLEVDQMIDRALQRLGGEDWLVEQARERPEAFMSLVGRRVKRQVEVSGPGWSAIVDAVNRAQGEQAARREQVAQAIGGALS